MGFYEKHKIIFALLFLIAGILVSGNNVDTPKILLISLSLTILALSFLKKDLILLLFFPVAIFLSNNAAHTPQLPEKFLDTKVSLTGKLFKNPEKRETTWRLFVKAKEIENGSLKIKTDTKLVIYLRSKPSTAFYGSTIKLKDIKLQTIQEFKNPGSFNLRKHFEKKGILYTGFIDNPKNLVIENISGNYNYLLHKINKFRNHYENFVRENISSPESEIINAVTIGVKGGIPKNIRDDFSKLGISHLLAISGLHIGAISILIFFTVKWILKRSQYMLLMYEVPKLASIITIMPILLYAALAGFATPVIRASIMITIYFFSVFFNRDESKINILAAAAILILIFDPNSLFDLSFRLSFIAVTGIIIFHHIFPFKLSSTKDKILSMLKTTVAATFFTLPLIINTFGYLPVATIGANIIAVPLVELLVVPAGLLSIVLYPVSESLCKLVLIFNSKVISILLQVADYILSFKYSYFTVPNINNLGYIFFIFTTILILMNKFSKKIKYLALLTFIGFNLTLFFNKTTINKKNFLEVNFLDAGNKSYNLISLPNNKKILVTGGYSYFSKSDFSEKAGVVPFLLQRGITQIDYLWLLSTDNSHLEGAKAITERIAIDNLWTNGSRLDGELWKTIRIKDIKWKNMSEELEELYFGDMKITFIKPYVDNNVRYSNEPRPILISIRNNNKKLLIAEGIDKNYVQKEINSIYKNKIRSDVVFINQINGYDYNFKEFIELVMPHSIITNKIRADIKSNIPDDVGLLVTSKTGMVTLYLSSENLKINKHNL